MADRRKDFTYGHTHGHRNGVPYAEWHIDQRGDDGFFPHMFDPEHPHLWTFPFDESHWDLEEPPPEVRAKYEELIGYDPDHEGEPFINVVEMISDEEGGFDQPCMYGNRCGGHAVYCHNEKWLYGPRKCRRTWYTGGERRDEDCPGYAPNPNFKVSVDAPQDPPPAEA